MISSQAAYAPPSASVVIDRQNDPRGIRLLLTQRKLYQKSKRWALFRAIGVAFALGADMHTRSRLPLRRRESTLSNGVCSKRATKDSEGFPLSSTFRWCKSCR